MKKLLLFSLLFSSSIIFSQEIKLPKGWSLISLRGKPAYINLTTGKVTRKKPENTKKVEEEISFSDDDEIFDPTITHTVLKGETVKSIAKKYDLGVDVLQLLNSEEKLKSVKVGDEIIIGYAHDMEEKKEFLKGKISILKHEHEH
ncbi:LysM peptidoglycan-binding domain-containing protein [Tenacibaculum crassostreae]|uniref:LysM peptidoglycan-binding domain-containing protein n=1 Tax=Tenacibaculum crassostreae TaxID=502683 RepID=UPI003895ACCB